MNHIIIKTPTVELFKILKFEGLASSGGEAKALIAEGKLKLNGITETQKRKKIVAGDIIRFAEKDYTIKAEA